MKNPFKIAEDLLVIIGLAAVGVLTLGVAVFGVAGAWAAGWGAWALTLPVLFVLGALVVAIVLALVEEGAGAINRRWRRAKWDWEQKHTSLDNRAELKEEK